MSMPSDPRTERRPGSHAILLHTHLPFVHHPEHEDFLEEDWLFEAVTESYLPLLFVLRDLEKDGVPFRLAITLTPPLLEMLRTPDLLEKYDRFLGKKEDLAAREARRLAGDPRLLPVARHYDGRFAQIRRRFEAINRDLPSEFARLASTGAVETLASSATHAFLPLLATDEGRRFQIRLGLLSHERALGRRPRGFWLPECGYMPGLDAILAAEGVEYVIFDTHGVLAADPPPSSGVHRPLILPSGVRAFARDPDSSAQVWSRSSGYPGDPLYRELYRDLGFDGDYDDVRPFLKPDGIRRNLGIKYHRVTGKVELHEKEIYDPTAARARTSVHAGHFLDAREEQVRRLVAAGIESPAVLSPYDTELFGHWWYEGPHFLEACFRTHAAGGAPSVRMATPSEILDGGGPLPRGYAHASSWGKDGYAYVWLNPRNDWMLRPVHEIEDRLIARARDGAPPRNDLERRALHQMAREMLLAQSSDWAFIHTMETSVHYAEKRFKEHVTRFFDLEARLDGGRLEEDFLADLETRDSLLGDLPLFDILRDCVRS